MFVFEHQFSLWDVCVLALILIMGCLFFSVNYLSKHGAYRPQKLLGLLGKGGRGYGGGGEGDYIPIATLSPPE